MSNVKTVCVYCGSSGSVDEEFKVAAKELGHLLARENMGVVYGGGHVGLMGIVADTALKDGAHVTGIIPQHIADKEVAHKDLSELHVVETMHERKQMMVDRSDAFVILPGGLGTMDEFFEAFTWWQLGLHDKPLILVNIKDYWTPLLNLIDNIIEHKFAREADREYLRVVDSLEELPAALQEAPRETIDPRTKWI